MLGQAASLINKLMAGRISGAPWWRNVRKGLIFKGISNSYKGSNAKSILSLYNTTHFNLIQTMMDELSKITYIVKPAPAFKAAYDKLVLKTLNGEEAMFFMYNPTSWSRSTKSGYEEIKIPGGKSVFHQASTPPQTFSLELLLDNSLWFNSDSLIEAVIDHAVGAISRGSGDFSGNGNEMGLRELQFYHYPSDKVDPFFSKPGQANYASLAPVINWYETLCRPDKNTQKCPEVFVAYQDMFCRCIVESCTTTILKSDWRQNINRATVALNFIVLDNLNLDKGIVQSEKDLLTATQG